MARRKSWYKDFCAVLFVIEVALVGMGCREAKMSSTSMAPTIRPGEKVTINLGAYAVDEPKRWDVVAFEPPGVADAMWVFRVVGMPGETVSFVSGGITLNGERLRLPSQMSNIAYVSLDDAPFAKHSRISSPYVVPKDHYFVLGDNSSAANDSRFWGGVPLSNILGRVEGK